MTTPQDPNQPGSAGPVPGSPQPQAPQPQAPQPPATQQPGPGWGRPQPGYPPGYAPGYPPPGYEPPSQYSWAAPGETPPPKRSFVRRHGCLLSMIVFLTVVLVLVVGCVVILAPTVTMDLKLVNDLGPRARQVEFRIENGQTVWIIHVTPGDEDQARDIACNVVRPDLAGTPFEGDKFEVVDSTGRILADNTTPCG